MTATKIAKVDPGHPQEDILKEAALVLASGGLVIIPTETVYGIACDASNKKALEKLFEIKKRPKDKPFTLHIADESAVLDYATQVPPQAFRLMHKFWPGPLTLILKAKDGSGVGLRLPDDAIARRVIFLSRVPVACPSANISGEDAPKDFKEAIKDLGGMVDFAIDAGPTKLGKESTIVDFTQAPFKVVREGAIPKSEIEQAAGIKRVLFVCTGNSCRSVMAEWLLKKKLEELGRRDVTVSSAGIMMLAGFGATRHTRELLLKDGIDASAHQSRKVTPELVRESDLILVMERLHEERLLKLAPEAKNRVYLLKEFAKIDETNLDIPDPMGNSDEFYAEVFAVIKEAVSRVAQAI